MRSQTGIDIKNLSFTYPNSNQPTVRENVVFGDLLKIKDDDAIMEAMPATFSSRTSHL